MTDQDLNYKVAELCGAKWMNLKGREGYQYRSLVVASHVSVFLEKGLTLAKGTEAICQIHALPNYAGDLNAMHEAESKMTREQQREYTKLLHPRHVENLSADWCILHTSARKKAEAFVKIIEEQR